MTIVTPSYNQARFLEEAILSVLDQGYPNLEYIIQDGGSTDGSRKIIERYAARLAHWESGLDDGRRREYLSCLLVVFSSPKQDFPRGDDEQRDMIY